MSRDGRLYFEDALAAAEEALALTRGLDAPAFVANRAVYLAVERTLFILGEALSRVTPEARRQHPEIAWSDIIGLRNILAHGYFGVDPDILWRTLQDDVPLLVAQLQAILGKAE